MADAFILHPRRIEQDFAGRQGLFKVIIMDRFSAFLLTRRHLKEPSSRNRAVIVESIMELLAQRLGYSPNTWSLLGLLSQLDLEYSRFNPICRGKTARQQAELEGLDPDLAQSLERWCMPESAAQGHTTLEKALFLAEHLAFSIIDFHGQNRGAAWKSFDFQEIEPYQAPECIKAREIDKILQDLQINVREAAQLAANALKRVAEELR